MVSGLRGRGGAFFATGLKWSFLSKSKAKGKYILALPGSSGGVIDAWDKILVHQLNIKHKPCNFVELLPRLKEK